MSSSDDSDRRLPGKLYERALADHVSLQRQLPEEAVFSLAREVLKRLAKDLHKEAPAPEDVDALASDLIGEHAEAAANRVLAHLKAGVQARVLYRSYLGRAAQLLGEQWESDTITFAELTIGIGRIYAAMRVLREHMKPASVPEQKSALFATIPGDTHTLGIQMASDMARKEGWNVDLRLDVTHDELVEAVRDSGQVLVGLSAGGEHALPNLARLVLALRISAPEALIVVSGHVVDVAQESVRLMHVDAIAREYDEAMQTLDDLWTSLQQA